MPTCRGQPPAGHVPCSSAAVPAQPTELRLHAAADRAVASVPSRFKGGQVRQACHQFTTTAKEGLLVHGALRAPLPDWVSCLAGRSHVEDRFPAGVTGKMPSPSAQHRLVVPYSNQRQGTPSHGTRGDTQPCTFSHQHPTTITHPVCRAGRSLTIFALRRALCVKEQDGMTGTGTSRHRASCFVRASTSKLPRRLRAKWLWPQRQLPPGSGTQLPAGSATRESPPQVGVAW